MKVGELHHSEKSKVFPAALETLYEMLKFVKEQASAAGFNNTVVSKIELAAEEALVNIISHGYPETSGDVNIICENINGKSLRLTIIDSGVPFNPLDAIKSFTPKSIESPEEQIEQQVGGYGIYFIVNMMDHVDYQREDNKNILILEKHNPSVN
ncbi:MAG: ATP-binding protein [Chlamydiota bacterium]|nr:ATP-binding protein [Chlamydiota bacterium]